MTDTAQDRILAAHALDGTRDKNNSLYATWAADYDSDMREDGYRADHVCALLTAQVCLDDGLTNANVVDMGCGTGFVGVDLAGMVSGASVVGADLSQDMTDAAERTGAYARVVPDIDLNEKLPDSLGGPFDVAVCCGTFVHGHVGPHGLRHLLDVVKPGGAVVFSTRRSTSEQEDFPGVVDTLVREGAATVGSYLYNAPYTTGEGGDYWTLRRS